MTITIYLSSTYEDLKEHRRVVHGALRKSGYRVIAMEDYVAADDRPLNECLRDIHERAQVYVGIFAFRYGYIPPEEHVRACPYTAGREGWTDLSITELEYRYAREIGRTCLVFVAKENQPWDLEHTDAYTERKQPHPGQRIDRLRRHLLQERLASEFSSPHELASLVQAAVAKHIQATAPPPRTGEQHPVVTWDIHKKKSPYPGLMRFTRKYSPVFFGRQAELREVIDRLQTRATRFLVICGDSGVGKSSFVEAGLLPVLEDGGLPGAPHLRCRRMKPSGGDHPFDALMRCLHEEAQEAGLDAYQKGKELRRDPSGLDACVRQITQKGLDGAALVLFLDQMEELFTSQAREQADAFLTALCRGVDTGTLRVIATIRSDHLHHCERHPELLKVLRGRGYYPLGQVDAIAMAEMIREPARCAGLEISDRLVRRILKDCGAQAGSLPMLAFVLKRLFELRDGRTLSEAVYDKIGGVGGAIAEHVAEVEAELRADGRRDRLLPKLFQKLVVVDTEGLPTRRYLRRTDLEPPLRALADRLIEKRLLMSEGPGDESMVSVSHEKLFEAWPSLNRWVEENKDDLYLRRQVRRIAAVWDRDNRDDKYLWADERIMDVAAMVDHLGLAPEDFSPTERAFLGPFDIQEMLGLIDKPETPHRLRATIGRRLSLLGDPRPRVGLRADGLPDIAWCDVPGGEVTLDTEGLEEDTFQVEAFRIAKYPVTWAQYRAFLEARDGYGNESLWDRLAYHFDKPSRQFNPYDNHPAENLTWIEAVVFCRWLSGKLGCEIKLPTEYQWQQAATGGDPERTYPWGPDWDPERANTYESELNGTTAVGMYPRGASPVGALDMSGNVWEWCLNEYDVPSALGEGGKAARAVRGGSWNSDRGEAAATFRGHYDLNYPSLDVGFRVCRPPHIS